MCLFLLGNVFYFSLKSKTEPAVVAQPSPLLRSASHHKNRTCDQGGMPRADLFMPTQSEIPFLCWLAHLGVAGLLCKKWLPFEVDGAHCSQISSQAEKRYNNNDHCHHRQVSDVLFFLVVVLILFLFMFLVVS